MAFPWDNLITAASTLIVGLGGVGLKGRSNRKDRADEAKREDDSARDERLRLAYADLVTSGTEMLRNLGQLLSLRQRYTQDHPICIQRAARGEELGGQLARAITVVQL